MRERETIGGGAEAEAEVEAGSILSRDPHAGLDPGTLRS